MLICIGDLELKIRYGLALPNSDAAAFLVNFFFPSSESGLDEEGAFVACEAGDAEEVVEGMGGVVGSVFVGDAFCGGKFFDVVFDECVTCVCCGVF